VKKKYMSISVVKGKTVPIPYTDQSLLFSPSIMKPNPVSAVNARLEVRTYMSFPIALVGPFKEKEEMEREEEEKDDGMAVRFR
jgi:hypothetical protein